VTPNQTCRRTCRRSGVMRCGPEGVCSERCRQLVMGP